MELDLDLLFDESAHGTSVDQITWRPGTRQVLGCFDDGNGTAWWLFDCAGGRALLARPEDFGATSAGEVDRTRWSADGRLLLVLMKDDFCIFDVAEKSLRTFGGNARIVGFDPRTSPDGSQLAYIDANDLYVLDFETGERRPLSDDGRVGIIWNGATDWVYWEEIWNRDSVGFWWSPDGRRLAFYHIDDRNVPVYPIVDTQPLHPLLERQRYPKVGDPLPSAEIRVHDLETGRTVRLDTGDGRASYLCRVAWHPDGEHLAVERLNRAQNRLDLLLFRADEGGVPLVRELAVQEWPTWINLSDELTFLADGRFLWSSEESGWRHLYLYSADGRDRRRLTPDGWALTALDAVHEETGWFLFTAHRTDRLGAAERHVLRGRLDAQSPGGDAGGVTRSPVAEELTMDPAWHLAAAVGTDFWVEEKSTAEEPLSQTLRPLDGSEPARLPRHGTSYELSESPRWRYFTIPGPGGVELPAQMLEPAGLDPERRHPVIMHHYGCPSSQVVDRRWPRGRRRFLWHRWMAERGYGIFLVDNESSAFFGKNGEDKMHLRFGETELRTQLCGIEYLKTLPWVDPSRIGLWGWSGGGSSTLYCLFRSPGSWKAGVAGAPVTDWRYYDAVWMERYLGQPNDNEAGYEASAPLTYANALEDALLLAHGLADDNVHPQNSINLIQALISAGAQFELALFPNERHSLENFEVAGQRHFYEKMTSFFDRHLGFEPS